MSRSNIPALPPIIQGLPSTSVGGSEGHCPLPTVSELQELPPHKTLSPAPRPPAQSSSLEGRVAALEQANYSLLEELVRMHSKLRAGQRAGVDERQEELGSLRGQLQQMQEELQGLSSRVLHATVERQSVEETSRQLRLSIEGVEAKVATSSAGLTTWKDSFQSRLEQAEGDMRVQWQGVQETMGGLQRGLEQTREGLRAVKREGGEQAAALDTSLKVLCSRMDAADTQQQHMESVLQRVQEDLHQLFSQQEAWQRDSTHRFAQLEGRVAEVERGVDALRLSLADCERTSSERLSALERAVEEGLAEQDRSLQLVVQRLEETTREAEKEQERLAAALQAVAEGAQRELNSAEDRLLSRLQREELHWEEASRSQREAASLELQQVQEDIGKQIVQLGTQVDRHGDDFSSTIKRERVQTSKAMSALSDSIKLVQREGEASRRHLSDVLHAEVTIRQRELDALQSAMTELGRHVTEETGALTSGQQELEVAQAALRERLSRESAELLGALHSTSERVLQDVESRFRTAHATLVRLEQQDLDNRTKVSKLQQAVEASNRDLTRQIEVEQAARKAALAHLGELVKGRVSLEMHHEETSRHQEAHRQTDHHLAALRAQMATLQSTLNQLHLQAASEASHERGQLRHILTRLQAHLKVGEEEGLSRDSSSDRQPLGGQGVGSALTKERCSASASPSPGHSLGGGSEGLNSDSRGRVDDKGAFMASDLDVSVSATAAVRSVRTSTSSAGEEDGETESSAGGEEGEGGNCMGAASPPENHQLQCSGSLVQGIPLDVQEGDILDIADCDVITLEQDRPSSGVRVAVEVDRDSEASSGVVQESSSVMEGGKRISSREGSDGDRDQELGQAVESGEEDPEQSNLVEPEKTAEEKDADATGAAPRVPSRPSTLLGRTSSVFIKYEDGEGIGQNEEETGSLNQWGVYQAWRLLQIKAAWMRPLRKKAAEQQRDSPQ